ncbi:MAG: hypothetical protein ACJAYU_005450 [Bradymonadia bacterium]|jgi:hypothetical protein
MGSYHPLGRPAATVCRPMTYLDEAPSQLIAETRARVIKTTFEMASVVLLRPHSTRHEGPDDRTPRFSCSWRRFRQTDHTQPESGR